MSASHSEVDAGLRRQAVTAALDEVASVTAEHLRSCDTEAAFPDAALEAMRRTGLLGLIVPTEYGGLGGSLGDIAEAGIRLGRVDLSTAMIFVMHCQQVAALVGYSNGRLREEVLPAVAAGHLYLASITTEESTGGALLSTTAELKARNGRLLLDRTAPIVTGGDRADAFLVTMRSPGAVSPQQTSLVYAARTQVEVEASGEWQSLGMRASHSVALRLRGSIPGDQVVGRHGDFRAVVTSVFGPTAHIGWSACWLGTAAGALSRTLGLLRTTRGTGLGARALNSELLLTRLSVARRRLDTVHALLTRSLHIVETADDLSTPRVQLLLNALKITAAEECYRAVDGLVEAVGLRHGYLKESPTRLEQALRDLRSAALNYHNDRLNLVDGTLALLDPEVSFA
ncbi:alkylation response protein AidB-like acyl-CoA dehydrogenase [Streptomyces sp. 846.5]|nr:acyl-CoA dehydrogenase family protein [Streptomyces sp. 846.5]TDU04449.1 alkylation response protein AidB-like acyl-CoA dehydrogenase [Streptomyces sp. 846.5]